MLSAVRDVGRPEPPPPRPLACRVVGLDLGKLSDFSALALLEWSVPPAEDRPRGWKPDYGVTTLKRWPLGTAYLDIVARLVKFLAGDAFRGTRPLLVIDATGVGEAVAEAAARELAEARARGGWCGVTITGGGAVTCRGAGRWAVAKKQLVSHLQVVMGDRRLHVAPDLPEARTLLRELEAFTVKITDAGNESFESWRERDHDDLVLAVALAVWAAEHGVLYQSLLRPPAGPKRLRA